jgi:hypothetical protein
LPSPVLLDSCKGYVHNKDRSVKRKTRASDFYHGLLGDALIRSAPRGAAPPPETWAKTHIVLTKYDAHLTTYDKPVTLGAPPDFSKGSIEIDMCDVETDTELAALVKTYMPGQ